MYYFEKDYIMRLIHGIARAIARMLFGDELPEDGEIAAVLGETCRGSHDYLRRMIDSGQINAAEDKLFDLIGSAAWESRQKAAMVLSFYDYVNSKDDEFLNRADFSRDEIVSGLEDAMKALDIGIYELLDNLHL